MISAIDVVGFTPDVVGAAGEDGVHRLPAGFVREMMIVPVPGHGVIPKNQPARHE